MSIVFVPRPRNDFPEFIETYYSECRSRFPGIECIAGKWTFEDLIPGMSDFDARFICRNDMTADDWCRMSMAVSQTHLELCKRHPEWARILEHLPGINLTWNELTDESTYYPEYKQWTFYHSSETETVKQAGERLAKRPWDAKDEYFHLKKFLLYYGPYDRAIDPAVNLGPYENKYPLHSRMMHYFTPPAQSAISILQKEAVRGKAEALRLAGAMFPETGVFAGVLETVKGHYEVPDLYDEPGLSELERRLFDGLKRVCPRLAEAITILGEQPGAGPEAWKSSLNRVQVDPSLKIFDNAKFARLMKGRLYFYTHVPPHFDSVWCIRVELNRIGNNFFRVPFSTFWGITRGEKVDDPAEIVPRLSPEILTHDEVECTLAFDRLTRMGYEGREIEIAGQIVEIYDGFFRGLYKISRAVRRFQEEETRA
jgi:hypothetical protein